MPLIANLDALFDAGLISFDASGAMLISESLSDSEQVILLSGGRRLRKPLAPDTARYLEFHRQQIFQATESRRLQHPTAGPNRKPKIASTEPADLVS